MNWKSARSNWPNAPRSRTRSPTYAWSRTGTMMRRSSAPGSPCLGRNCAQHEPASSGSRCAAPGGKRAPPPRAAPKASCCGWTDQADLRFAWRLRNLELQGTPTSAIEAAKAVKGKVDARILWNRFRASTNSAKELSESVRTELDLKQLETKIGYRVAYSEALARGMTALEWNDRQAQTEMLLLGAELNQILKTQLWS